LEAIYETSMYVDDNYALFSYAYVKPFNFKEARANEPRAQAMEDEISKMEKNDTWELVDLPNGKSIIGVTWIYKIKFNMDGSISKYNTQLATKGHVQQEGIDYEETFSPVARFETVRTFLFIAS
jgi:hypothetical protein